MDRWQTLRVPLVGGLRLNLSPLEQGTNYPGSLIQSTNFEPSLESGYRRVTGYAKFDSNTVTGTGTILGSFYWEGFVVAMRGTEVYSSSGSGWTKINGAATRTGAGRYDATKYCWGGVPRITFADGTNYPAKWDGTTYTELTNAPQGAEKVETFANHLFLAKGDTVTFSAPYDDTDYQAANGAGSINIGCPVVGMKAWRDELYIFARSKIFKITGTSLSDFALANVTGNLGCVDGFSIQELAGDLIFLSHDSIRTVAGTDRIGDVELGTISEPIRTLLLPLDEEYQTGEISSVALMNKAQYRLFTCKSTDDADTAKGYIAGLRYSNGNTSLEWGQLEGFHVSCADAEHYDGQEYVIHAGYDGYIYRQEVGNDRDGSAIVATFSMPYLPFDDPVLRKVVHKMEIFVEVEGTTDFSISPVFDYDAEDVLQPPPISVLSTGGTFSVYDDPSFTYDGAGDLYDTLPDINTKFNLTGSFLNCSFTFSSNNTAAPYTIREIILRYSLHGGR